MEDSGLESEKYLTTHAENGEPTRHQTGAESFHRMLNWLIRPAVAGVALFIFWDDVNTFVDGVHADIERRTAQATKPNGFAPSMSRDEIRDNMARQQQKMWRDMQAQHEARNDQLRKAMNNHFRSMGR